MLGLPKGEVFLIPWTKDWEIDLKIAEPINQKKPPFRFLRVVYNIRMCVLVFIAIY